MQPNISIIVPVFNTGKYLEKCIESILKQTYRNFELILVNDGSTDLSGEICDNYKNIDSRIKVIHQENLGVSSARNKGLEIAQAKYVAFIDSDDWIESSMFEELWRSGTMETDLVLCGLQRIDKKNNIIYKTSFRDGTQIHCDDWKEEDFYILLNSYSLFQPVCKLYRLKIIKDEGIRFNPELNFGEDFIFNINYLKHCKRIQITNKILYNYRSLGQGLSSTFNLKKAFSYSFTKDSLIKFATTHNVLTGNSKEFIIKNILQDFTSCINQMFNSSMRKQEKIQAINIMKNSHSILFLRTLQEYRDKYKIIFYLIDKDKYLLWYLYSKIKKTSSITSVFKKKFFN